MRARQTAWTVPMSTEVEYWLPLTADSSCEIAPVVPPARPGTIAASAARCSRMARSSRYRRTRHGEPARMVVIALQETHITGRSAGNYHPHPPSRRSQIFGRETVDSASGPAFPVLAGYGRRVGSLGPGLTSDSADAVRAVLRDDLSAGPQVYGIHRRCRSDLPGLCKRPGVTGPTASGCVPSLNLRKG